MFLDRFTETETYMEVFSLLVEITDPECSIIKLGPKSLEVPEFYGLSDPLDGNVVSFHYESRSNLECSVHISIHDIPLPAHGRLVTGEPEKATTRGDEPESFVHLRQQLGNSTSIHNEELVGDKASKTLTALFLILYLMVQVKCVFILWLKNVSGCQTAFLWLP